MVIVEKVPGLEAEHSSSIPNYTTLPMIWGKDQLVNVSIRISLHFSCRSYNLFRCSAWIIYVPQCSFKNVVVCVSCTILTCYLIASHSWDLGFTEHGLVS